MTGQTDEQTAKETDEQMAGQTDKLMVGRTDKQINKETGQMDRQKDTGKDIRLEQTDRQTYNRADKL